MHGGARADAARGGRARARRHRARRTRGRPLPRAARSSPRCSARCSSRSARTSPTTTPTRGAAPTPRTASGPVRVTAGGLVPPRQVLIATYVTFGLAVLCGAYLVAVAGWELLAVGAASILAGVLYTGGPRPVRLRGPGRGVRVPVLRHRRRRGLLLRAARAPAVGGVRARRAGRPARRARSSSSTTCATSTPTAARASARSRCGSGASARAASTPRWSTLAFLIAPLAVGASGSLSPWLLLRWLALPLAVPLVRIVRNAHRRAVAERRAGGRRAARARLLRAARRPASLLS